MAATKRRVPKQKRSRERVQAMIRVAARMIEQDGYRDFSTNKLARRAGVGVASVYEYFSNKEEILIAVLELELSDFARLIESRIPDLLTEPPREALRGLFRAILSEVAAKAEFVRAIASHINGASQHPATIRFFGQGELVARLLLAALGGRNAADVAFDAYVLTHAFAGVCLGLANGLPHGATIDDLSDRMVELVLLYMGADQNEGRNRDAARLGDGQGNPKVSDE